MPKWRKKRKPKINWKLTDDGLVPVTMPLSHPDQVVITSFYTPAFGTLTIPEEAAKAISENGVPGTYECYFRLDGTLVRIEAPKKSKKKLWELGDTQ